MEKFLYASNYLSVGVVIAASQADFVVTVSDGLSTMLQGSAEQDYIPLVSFALENLGGPIKDCIDELTTSRLFRKDNRSTICTRYLQNLLKLWSRVLEYWMNRPLVPEQSLDTMMEVDPRTVLDSTNRKRRKSCDSDSEEPIGRDKRRRLLPPHDGDTSQSEPSSVGCHSIES
ncbi:hypothetical protein FRC18_004629 [Serendipita sp. 400]|nr:hypothetical protein FRC18_004629 [Serendipita sp. 400]